MPQKESAKRIAFERMERLLSLSQSALRKGDEKHAKRYVFLARKISLRYNCRFTPQLKAMFCKKCGMPRIIGKNTTVRLRKRTRVAEYACSCGSKAGFKY